MKLIKERSMAVVYDAVSISKDIEAIGGPTTLNFYADSNTFVPNRFLTPLVLKPIVYIADPNKVIPDGDKSKELTECYWFENGVKIATGDDYRINEDNTLTVLKNSQSDLEISFSAKWLDPRKGQEITIEDSIKLVCISLSEEGSNPRITLDRPINWIHNPLKGERIYSIKAYISKDKVYEGAVEWYYTKQKGKPELINKEHLFYVEGQYTNELKVNSIYLEDGIITAKNLSNDKLKEYYWFFDENGNPISYNEPLFTELKGADIFNLPPETLENKAKLNLDGLTILNLVENGDFSDGVEGWKGNVASLSIKDGNLAVKVEKKNLATGILKDLNKDYAAIATDDLYYLAVAVFFPYDTEAHFRVGVGVTGEAVMYKKGWNLVVTYGRKRGDSTMRLYVDTLNSNYKEGDTIEFKYINIINLTRLFNKGNEPSKEWCDEHIKGYIDGTQSVKLPMRVTSRMGNYNLLDKSGYFDISEARRWVMPTYNTFDVSDDNIAKFTNTSDVSTTRLERVIHLERGLYTLSIKSTTPLNFSTLENAEKINTGSNGDVYYLIFRINTDNIRARLRVYYTLEVGESFDVEYFKLEEGDKPTQWMPSENDSVINNYRKIGYITNNIELRSLPKIKDYIKDGKIYKNIARYYFSDKDNWTLRKEHKADNFRYSTELPFNYKTTGKDVEGELLCNNFTPAPNIPGVAVERDSNTIALYKENNSTIYLTLDKKVDDVNNVIPEGTFIDVILPETEILDLHTEGKLISYPNGTIFLDYFNREEGVYKDGFTLSKEFTLDTLVYISRNTQDIDVSKATIKDGILTHPDLNKGEYIQIGYTYKDCSIYGDNTIEYLNLANLLDEIIVEDVYTYRPIKDNEGLITDWEFIKLTDIEDYNKWLKEERTSPYSLAPDGIIFGQYSTQTKFLRQFPSSLEADFILPSRLKEGTKNVTARAIIKTSKEIINNPENFFKITWYRRPNRPGADNIVIGEGEQVTLDVAHKDAIILEVEDLGVLKPVKDNRGRYLLDNQDKIITTR